MTRWLSSRNLLGSSSLYAIGTVARQLVGFLMLPIYTRYLSPADYGAVGLLTLTLALLEPFLGMRLGGAISKFYFDEISKSSFIYTLLLNMTYRKPLLIIPLPKH